VPEIRKIEMKPSQAKYFSGSFMFLACLAFGLILPTNSGHAIKRLFLPQTLLG
jgi:hypothetical protein